MLSKEEMGSMAAKGRQCPYGRDCKVRSEACQHCKFNHVESFSGPGKSVASSHCDGDVTSVSKHVAQLRRRGLVE